ncbi:MAG: hypothetical protein WA615_31610, partial [Bradyrhizobium sp.]|uniref:hypothetical protein n=1 Tax=Bradyrhizobium sp. TaxID=376 RepID=UPI003C7B3ED4
SQPATGLSALAPALRAGAQRLCALALFGRRPSVPGDSFVIPASENLHTSGHGSPLYGLPTI